MRYNSLFAGFLVLAAVSCQKEEKLVSAAPNDSMDGISVFTESDATRCESHGKRTLFEDMPYVTASGDTLYISASLSNMRDPVIGQTKAAPIAQATAIPGNMFYTYVYKDAGPYASVHSTPASTENTLMSNVPIKYASANWSFDKTYYWPSSETEVLHFVSMGPAVLVDSSFICNLSESGYGWNTSGKTLKGRYQSRKNDIVTDNDAVNLNDFVYGYDSQSKSSHSGSVDIVLKHACVGVRFIVGDIFGTIGSISLNNFYKDADFTIGGDTLTWSGWGSKTQFKQVFNKTVDNTNKGNGEPVDNTTGETKTFMVIPQTLQSDAEMIIDMKNTLHPENLSFEKICDSNPGLSKDWTKYQGKIITFSVSSNKANSVSVAFNDTVIGNVKSNLKFVNDGKSAIYIRACLVGNWLNKDGKVLTSWSETASNIHGDFESTNDYFPKNVPSTAAGAISAGVNWVKGADGFYYYAKILKSGSTASKNLFDTFTVNDKPSDSEGSWNTTGSSDESMQIVSFEMAILVQAVSAQVSGTGTLTKDYAKIAWGSAVENYLTVDYE